MPAPALVELTPAEVREAMRSRPDVTLVDVREPAEHAIARIEGAVLIPLRTIPQQLEALPRDHEIILFCHHGMRSEMAGRFLLAQGYARVAHLPGGIDRWSDEVDQAVPKY
ncbi:MAG: sulfurtransferase [Gemmatimonadaceae bacterium]|nr:sulfurtransferase [Gemmatimonadaceae bacterium]